MHIFYDFQMLTQSAIKVLFPEISEFQGITSEAPKNSEHGDVSTNAAMILAKVLKANPREIAETLVEEIKKHKHIAKVEVAGPGFINVTFHKSFWHEELSKIHAFEGKCGIHDFGKGKKINIEFVSANPTGPMHLGHSRGAIYGDALANLLAKCGFDVTREYYINDAGRQIDILAESVLFRFKELLGNKEEIGEGLYPGEYLIEVAQELKAIHGENMPDKETIKHFCVGKMMELIKSNLKSLGVTHEVFTSEKHDIHEKGKIDHSIKLLESKGLVYKGTLDAPKGKTMEDWEPREQTLFRATKFGDDTDRPVQRSDETYTYFAADIAYHLDKIERGFRDMILILGADHGGYVKRMKAVVSGLSDDNASIDIKISQLVKIMKDGQPFKMSKRAGTFITVEDLLKEVDKDILRFVMLSRKNDSLLEFDLEKVKEQSKDNPVFYVQYAHTRARSVIRTAEENNIKIKEDIDFSVLEANADIALIKKLLEFPKVIESAVRTHEPHRITYYLNEIASEFHHIWSLGNQDKMQRFVIPDNSKLSMARIGLVNAVARLISTGLEIMGIKALEKM